MAEETRTLADLKDALGDDGAAPADAQPEATAEPKIDQHGRAYGTGRRKSSVARVWIKPGAGLPAEYIACADPVYDPLANDRERAKGFGWPMRQIAAGHDCMISAPEALADLLESAP